MKKILFIVSIFLCLTACEETLPILPTDLPATSQEYIHQHFINDNIDVAIREKENLKTEYKVILSSGYQLEFKKDGTCKKVDCAPQAVPESIILPVAFQYVQTTFPNSIIVRYELEERDRFQLELNNEIELLFDKDGQIIKMDD